MNNKKQNNPHLRIVLYGSGGVGKSTILIRFLLGKFIQEYDPTIEESYRKEIELNDEKIIFEILDSAGCEEDSIIIKRCLKFSDFFVLVYSVDNKFSFKEINYFHELIKRYLLEKNENKKDYPKILIGNKSDLFTKRRITCKQGKELAKKLNCKFIETSAKTGENVHQLFYESIILAIQDLEKNPNKYQNKYHKKKGKCLLM
ncbi:small gtp-binding protein domain [Anaeramoeba ignava]|uniref:Small gtp-binding protein domain n=1 Tax=Anaeramoeba ignava TaxID=1746090 RepID=A0A9Q0LBU9_ANAIG|nr:small gtp-binding protein domain [Anaeramoeba ignava]